MNGSNSTASPSGQSRNIFGCSPLMRSVILRMRQGKLEWFDSKGKFLVYGRVKGANQ